MIEDFPPLSAYDESYIESIENQEEYEQIIEFDPNVRVSSESEAIKESIDFQMASILETEAVKSDLKVIDEMITSSFWSGQKSKMNSLNSENSLVIFCKEDSFNFLQKIYGHVVSYESVMEAALLIDSDPAKAAKIAKSAMLIPHKAIIEHIMLNNQRERIEMRVDMFADTGRVEMLDEMARVVYPHYELLPKVTHYDQSVIDDYKQHFPMLDDFINFVVASRFARDRKKSYLWLKCESDWGKGFLLGILAEFGLTVDLSIPEISSLMSGSPVGRSMSDFKRAMVMSVDEFKTMRDEVKRLQNSIDISPKNQLSACVEIFVKLFTSADDVPSLAGDNGVEDQFANRFSFINGVGVLEKRDKFKACGSGYYFDNVASYFASAVNLKVEEMRSYGRVESENRSAIYLKNFHKKHGIGNNFKRLSMTLDTICEEMVAWFVGYAEIDMTRTDSAKAYSHKVIQDFSGKILKCDRGDYYLKSYSKAVDDYLHLTLDRPQLAMVGKRKVEMISKISADDDYKKPRRIVVNGKSLNQRFLKLKVDV